MVKVKEDLVKQIIEQLQDIQYGALLITVHNDEITQLDVTRKQRFDRSSRSTTSQKSTLKHIV